jgi:hypothetical protein
MFRFLVIFLLAFTSCSQTTINADSSSVPPQQVLNDEPQKITVCELQRDPASFNHKLVEVTGFISHGFEDFTIFDPNCKSKQGIWVEYGGKTGSGTMYCCDVPAERQRSEPLVVEGIATSLEEDEQFRALTKLLRKPPASGARATVIGRFFAGKRKEYTEDKRWGGFGHMGCCSLFIIQRVVSVSP